MSIHGICNNPNNQTSCVSYNAVINIASSTYKFTDMYNTAANKPTYTTGTVEKLMANENGFNSLAFTITALTENKWQISPNYGVWSV